jgi:hypothetical protein
LPLSSREGGCLRATTAAVSEISFMVGSRTSSRIILPVRAMDIAVQSIG